VATPTVAGVRQTCWDFDQLPFRHLAGSRRALRSELLAVFVSGCENLLLFSGLQAVYWLLQSRSGPVRARGCLTAARRRLHRHILPALRQPGVGRGLQRDPFSEHTDSAGEL